MPDKIKRIICMENKTKATLTVKFIAFNTSSI